MPLYLGLVLSDESSSSMDFLLLLLLCCSCCCCCSSCFSVCCNSCCCCCCGCCCCGGCCCLGSGFWHSWSKSCFCCPYLALNIWGLSLFTSDSRTGFRKNSSAPSSKHLIFDNCQLTRKMCFLEYILQGKIQMGIGK